MKSLSRRSLLLFGVVLVVCAFAVPSLASAATWSVVGTTHQLFAPDLQFLADQTPFGAPAGWTCVAAEFDSDVVSANTIEVTDARLKDCMGNGAFSPCTVTTVATGLPWTVTATSTTNVQIHGVNIDLLFENTPGQAVCPAQGAKALLTGTLTGGSWNPTNSQLTLAPADNLTAHFLGVGFASEMTLAGTVRDTSGTLRMFM